MGNLVAIHEVWVAAMGWVIVWLQRLEEAVICSRGSKIKDQKTPQRGIQGATFGPNDGISLGGLVWLLGGLRGGARFFLFSPTTVG